MSQTATDSYWLGPYGIKIFNEIDHIIAADGYNTMSKNGDCTEEMLEDEPEMTKEEYLAKYCIYNTIDNHYYWKGDKVPTINFSKFWIGAFNALVPNHIDTIIAEDGYNHMNKAGESTEKCCKSIGMTKEKYLEQYCTYIPSANCYIWKEQEPKISTINFSAYWRGIFNIWIPNEINSVPAADGYNSKKKSGGTTERECESKNNLSMTKEQYLAKYAVYDQVNNCYFWKQ